MGDHLYVQNGMPVVGEVIAHLKTTEAVRFQVYAYFLPLLPSSCFTASL